MKSFDEIIQEGKKTLSDKIVKEIQELTDSNNHAEARILICKEMKYKKLLLAFEGVNNIHEYYGNLTSELNKIRNDLDKVLFKQIKKDLSNGQEVYMSF